MLPRSVVCLRDSPNPRSPWVGNQYRVPIVASAWQSSPGFGRVRGCDLTPIPLHAIAPTERDLLQRTTVARPNQLLIYIAHQEGLRSRREPTHLHLFSRLVDCTSDASPRNRLSHIHDSYREGCESLGSIRAESLTSPQDSALRTAPFIVEGCEDFRLEHRVTPPRLGLMKAGQSSIPRATIITKMHSTLR
jgi:hypothetical protein